MKKWAIVIGTGLALFPLHNRYLAELATLKGQVVLFLPALGFLLAFVGAWLFIVNYWSKVKETGLGDKKVFIPLIIIAVAIAISGIGVSGVQMKLSLIGMGVALFSLYIVGRVLGKDMFLPLAIGAAIASVGVIVYALIYRGQISGGFVFEKNYDIVVGYVLLGIALFVHKRQPILAGLALAAMFLTGSPEALLPLGVVAIAMLIRKDWSRKLVRALVPLGIVVVVWFGLGWGWQLYDYAWGVIKGVPSIPSDSDTSTGNTPVYNPLEYRLVMIKDAIRNLKPFGTGYVLTWVSNVKNVHNVPLVAVQQLGYPGIIAALAWLWVTVYCFIKTKWKYVWLLIISLSVFDHFIWTQLGLWWWMIVGVTTASTLKSGLLFRRDNYVESYT